MKLDAAVKKKLEAEFEGTGTEKFDESVTKFVSVSQTGPTEPVFSGTPVERSVTMFENTI